MNEKSGMEAQEPVDPGQRTYGYDAFLSYRRVDGGNEARWLRRWLRNFRLPTSVKSRLPKEQVVREPLEVFIDEPYSRGVVDYYEGNILPALHEAEFLIVIASPSSLQPLEDGGKNWVEREIGDFLSTAQRQNLIVIATKELGIDPAKVTALPGGLLKVFARIQIICPGSVSWVRFLWPSSFWCARDAALACAASLHHIPSHLTPLLRQEDQRRRWHNMILAGLVMVAVGLLFVGMLYLKSMAEAREVSGALQSSKEFLQGFDENSGVEELAVRYETNRDRLNILIERHGMLKAPAELIATLAQLNINVIGNERIGIGKSKTAEDKLSEQTVQLVNELRRRNPSSREYLELELHYHEQRLMAGLSAGGRPDAFSLQMCEKNFGLLDPGEARTEDWSVREMVILGIGIHQRQLAGSSDLDSYVQKSLTLAKTAERLARGNRRVAAQCADIYSKAADVEGMKMNTPAALAYLADMLRAAMVSGDSLLLANMHRKRAQIHQANGAVAQWTADLESTVASMEAILAAPADISSFKGLAAAQGGIEQIYRATLVQDYLSFPVVECGLPAS